MEAEENRQEEEYLTFYEEEPEEEEAPVEEQQESWKVLIVDDEDSVHSVTRLVLDNFEFNGRKLSLYSAFSQVQAMDLMRQHPDISLILLDVVMEAHDAGLTFVQYVREELKNKLVRIILRTGQPGRAPERQVIVDYDINDYKLKTELTADKLFVSVVTALRSYEDLLALVKNEQGLEQIIEASAKIFQERALQRFAEGILQSVCKVMSWKLEDFSKDSAAVLFASVQEGPFKAMIGTGQHVPLQGKLLEEVEDREMRELVQAAARERKTKYEGNNVCLYIEVDQQLSYAYLLHRKKALGDWEKYMMEILVHNMSIAMNNISLTDELEATQREILFTLGEIAEARSKETSDHVHRVADYCRLLALKAGMPEKEAEMLWLASPVHDIGKLAVPDRILNKPDRLDDREYEVMKDHARAGKEILRNSKRFVLKAGAIVAGQHHERYDGKGYPEGLAGEGIHIYGRIAAIADVFDALASDRIYKKSWDMERIREFFEAEKGKRFDPWLVDLFLGNMEEFLEIKKRYDEAASNTME
ncbi:response regulator [Anaerotalea alkaliphila]|uniref:Stage 0 sporulation protein A homolog n=1 Tax=Anaerotalea alkaliphila TaxID=2662126 RepID=A0A7X5KLC7_9FIRM|nr:response regulator [Anaerotalea alkaliphila]NDL66559.1 DUF3369 domain-containing protein [Anaerotalea alkaliphila]